MGRMEGKSPGARMTPRPIYSGRQRYKSTCRPIANTHTICCRTVHYLATARGRRLLGRPGHANVRRAGHAPPGPARAPTQGVHPAHDRLLDQPKPTQANRVWVSDISCLPLATCCCAYLCAFQHVATKHVAGWHVTATIPERLVTTAVQRAFLAQPPTPELVIYSDRGGQCCSNAH